MPTVYGRSLVHKSVTQIIKAHRFARRMVRSDDDAADVVHRANRKKRVS